MFIPSNALSLMQAAYAAGQPRPIGGIESLRNFSQQGIDEFDRSGLGELESTIVGQGGRRSLADVARIGSEAGAMSGRAFDAAAGTAERQQRALGVTMDPTQRASYDRRLGLAKVLGNVDARNRALRSDQKRRDVIRTDSFGLRDLLDRQIYANLEGASNIEAGVQRDAAAGRAERSQNTASTLGSTAGMFASMFGGK